MLEAKTNYGEDTTFLVGAHAKTGLVVSHTENKQQT
jgi:hypothetical protein